MKIIKSPVAARLLEQRQVPETYRPFLNHVRAQLGNVDDMTALERLAFNKPVTQIRPTAGHAVLLDFDLSVNAKQRSIGVIQGAVGRQPEKACIAFNCKTFRGPVYPEMPHNFDQWIVQSQGGPITDNTPMDALLPANKKQLTEFWMYSGDRDDKTKTFIYSIPVTLWVWVR